MLKLLSVLLPLAFICNSANASIFGEENVPLYKLVLGQIIELERLAQAVGVAKETRDVLVEINRGIAQATDQISALEEIARRAKNLNPNAIKDISSLTDFINELKSINADTEEIVRAKLALTDEAIAQSAVQSNTAYVMGQEMIGIGSKLADESRSASPGRAAQISASAASSEMLSSGVMLQTMAQLTQLTALNLELKKTEMARDLELSQGRRNFSSKLLQNKQMRRL